MLTQEIQHQAHSRDITTRIWTDPRPREEQIDLLASLGKAAQERVMDGLITTISDPQHFKWMSRLPVPVAYLGNDFPSSVNADDIQLITDSLASLKQQGARSVGVIVPRFPADTNFPTSFQMECKALGLDTRPEWIFALKVDKGFLDPFHEQYGCESFQQLWAQKERPEGLIVFPDGVARGALLALMARQVRVPEELKLVFHRNAGVPFFCPVEAAFAVTPVREIASALLQQIDTVFQGRSPQSILVKNKIEAGAKLVPV
jgi:DNA-binding LacI/PurR family transcriptional regulator